LSATPTIKRIYEPAGEGDGVRVLVDRLWPRGVSKQDAALDRWLKEIAPTPELRAWFGHEPGRFEEFADRYRAELEGNPALDCLLDIVREAESVTLLYAARDPDCNHAAVLRDFTRDALAG
jgi:uncharacterized protein YeaO (DUF488 family)